VSDDEPSPAPTPAEAVSAVDGDPSTQATAEGADVDDNTNVGSSQAVRNMLTSTEPDRPLSEVEAPYDPENGGLSRLYRAVQKMTGVDGMPAIADLVIGAVEVAQGFELQGALDSDNGKEEEPTGPVAEAV